MQNLAMQTANREVDVRNTNDLKTIVGDGIYEVRSLDLDWLHGRCERIIENEHSEEKIASL